MKVTGARYEPFQAIRKRALAEAGARAPGAAAPKVDSAAFLGLTEAEAFRWIKKTAMDLRKPMREVAEGVIEHRKSGGKSGKRAAARKRADED